jgi:hypothetical protein
MVCRRINDNKNNLAWFLACMEVLSLKKCATRVFYHRLRLMSMNVKTVAVRFVLRQTRAEARI